MSYYDNCNNIQVIEMENEIISIDLEKIQGSYCLLVSDYRKCKRIIEFSNYYYNPIDNCYEYRDSFEYILSFISPNSLEFSANSLRQYPEDEKQGLEYLKLEIDNYYRSNHGGSRTGAGRPVENIVPTKIYRLPENIGNFAKSGKLESLLSLIEDWRDILKDSSPTSPRYDKLREFFAEVDRISPDSFI